MLRRYSLLAGSIYKSKLNEFVFYNLKPVKLHVACITEQNLTQDRTFDKGTKDKFNKKLRYQTKIQRTDKTSKVLEIRSFLGFHVALRGNFVRTFRDNLTVPSPPIGSDTSAWSYHSTLTLGDGSDRLSRSVEMGLPLDADPMYIAAEA
jgi:hypothetical protein